MRKGGEGVGAGGQGRAPPRLIVPPPGSTQVFICTTPLMKYDPCVPEKVRLPQRSIGKLSFRSSDLLKETMGTSLAVQRLRLCALNTRGYGFSPWSGN